MAFGTGTINSFGGAVQDILGAKATSDGLRLKSAGNRMEADNYDLAAVLSKRNAEYAETSTAIKETQAQRKIYMGLGETQSDIAGAGFSMSGTALDIMRQGVEEGALAKQVINAQGEIEEAGYREQGAAYTNMAAAARYAAEQQDSMAGDATRNAWITGGIKAASGIASLFMK